MSVFVIACVCVYIDNACVQKRKPRSCNHCGKPGHDKRNCPENNRKIAKDGGIAKFVAVKKSKYGQL
jgi:hypothetical protein